jgi:hypothetical protein
MQALLHAVRTHGPLAKRDTGKGLVSQVAEILALNRGLGRLAPDEYYQYCLYDDRRYSWREKTKFIGRAMEEGFIPILKARRWVGLAHDKLATYAFLKGMGFPVPETYAVYHPFRGYGSVPSLRTADTLARFIRTEMLYPFVAKPITGMWGRDVWVVESYDSARNRLLLKSGEELEVEALIDRLADRFAAGVLLQELLQPHPMIEDLCGPRICSVRMVAIVDRAGGRLLSTLWKAATGRNMADNYWGPGNLVGPVELETGRVGRMFTGLGRDIKYVDQHPDTGKTLTGAILPDWSAAVDLCLQAGMTLPGLPMQAWDIALTASGPVILEVNVNGGMRLPQLVAQRGLYTDEFRAFLAGFGFPRRRFSANASEHR